MVKKAARRGDGPWAEAIEYLYKTQGRRQADVVEGTGLSPNVVSRASRGWDVRTDTLRKFAEFFQVPLEAVLIAPTQRLDPHKHQQALAHLAAEFQRQLERQQTPPALKRPVIDSRLLGIARRLAKLSASNQRRVLIMIKEYEQLEKEKKHSKTAPQAASGHRSTGR